LGILSMQAVKMQSQPWEGVSSVQNDDGNDAHIYDPSDEEEEPPDREPPMSKPSLLLEYVSIANLRLTYEILGEGQLRHWTRNDFTNSCEQSLSGSPNWCGRADRCLCCNARQTEREDSVHNMTLGLAVARLKIYAHENNWEQLPDDGMFNFILELDNRL